MRAVDAERRSIDSSPCDRESNADAASARHRRPDSDGVTLVEILIAVMIMGIVGLATLSLMQATLKSSAVASTLATDLSALSSAAAFLGDPAIPISPCADGAGTALAAYQAAVDHGFVRNGRAGAVSVHSVAFWNGTSFGSSCAAGQRLQQVVLRVTSPSGVSRDLTITKRPSSGVVAS